MGDLDKPNWSLSKGTKLPALCMSPKPRLCHIWRVFGQAGALIHPTCTEQGIRIQSRETTGWVAHAEEKSPQPAKATLAAPTPPLWVLTSVSGSSTLLWRWIQWTRPGPGTMLIDSALQSLQGLCTKGTQMVFALRGAVRTSVAIWVPGWFVHILPEREAIKLPLIPPSWASRLFLHLQGTRNLFASILLFTTRSAILRILSHCVQSKRSAFIHSLIHSFNTS